MLCKSWNEIDPITKLTKTVRAPNGCLGVDGTADIKLVELNRARRKLDPNGNEGLDSRFLRRRLFRTHVEVTAINRDINKPIVWFSGKDIKFLGR
jgi:hypothetical protein